MTEIYKHLGRDWSAIELLNYWISEREKIRLLKEQWQPDRYELPPSAPWSQDPIFQQTYFTNVRREDDKVTRWLRQNWTPEVIGWEIYDYSMVLARFINNIPCLEGILKYSRPGDDYSFDLGDFDELEKYLDFRAANEKQVWGGAYVVTTHGIKMGKAAYLCQRVLPAAYAALHCEVPGARSRLGLGGIKGPTLASAHEQLMQLEGLGSFMAAQVVADLKNTVGHPLMQALDWSEWSAPGPGSLRGLEWVLGEKIGASRYRDAIARVATEVTQENRLSLQTMGYFNMQDLQNCLCEFDKMMRVLTRTGKSKRKYQGV